MFIHSCRQTPTDKNTQLQICWHGQFVIFCSFGLFRTNPKRPQMFQRWHITGGSSGIRHCDDDPTVFSYKTQSHGLKWGFEGRWLGTRGLRGQLFGKFTRCAAPIGYSQKKLPVHGWRYSVFPLGMGPVSDTCHAGMLWSAHPHLRWAWSSCALAEVTGAKRTPIKSFPIIPYKWV